MMSAMNCKATSQICLPSNQAINSQIGKKHMQQELESVTRKSFRSFVPSAPDFSRILIQVRQKYIEGSVMSFRDRQTFLI